MKVVVLGAGVVGVTSAWYLARAGHEVTVVERREGAALETSFANGGQISASHVVPWANPAAPAQILRWLGRRNAPLSFRPRADWRQWLWGARFLLECTPHRTRENARALLALSRASLVELRALRRETGIEYRERTRGILGIYTERRAFERAVREAEWISALGARREPCTPARCTEIEPALRAFGPRLVGGVYAPDDESGDAHAFTVRLAQLCEREGVAFLYGHEARRLAAAAGRVSFALVRGRGTESALAADAFVVALGPHSPALLRSLGVELPVYPVKGYSVTLPAAPGAAPEVSLTDEERRLVFSRLGDELRVAGMADISGYDAAVDERRCRAIVERLFEIFPGAGERAGIRCWAGLRPATPGNVPLIGAVRYPNLFLNTGHGTLGWTLACGSAAALAELVSGRRPAIEFPFLSAS
jgi:D-amino-acid dehydrogenase